MVLSYLALYIWFRACLDHTTSVGKSEDYWEELAVDGRLIFDYILGK